MSSVTLPRVYTQVEFVNAFGGESIVITINGIDYRLKLPHPLGKIEHVLESFCWSINDDYTKHMLMVRACALPNGIRIWSPTGDPVTVSASSSSVRFIVTERRGK